MSKKEPKLRANVAAILRNREGKILICERIQIWNAWQFPQGGVDDGETLEQALTRELREEIGIEPGDFRIVEMRSGYMYMFPGGRKKGFEGKDRLTSCATSSPMIRRSMWRRSCRSFADGSGSHLRTSAGHGCRR